MVHFARSFGRYLQPGCGPGLPVTPLTLTVLAIPLLALTMIVSQLVGIERLAAATRAGALPTAVAQQKRAIWTETLRNAAKVVALAPEREIRNGALAKAEQLAQNLGEVADPGQAEALRAGIGAIRRTAGATHAAEEHDATIRAMLQEADAVITDMSANLTSIVEDSAVALAHVIDRMLAEDGRRDQGRSNIETVLALNTTSRDLLASLDQGRLLLAAGRTMETPERLERAARRFAVILATLRARVGTLGRSADEARLPDMIERFAGLAEIFDLRARALENRALALGARAQAESALAALREDLSAEAIAAAERSVEAIAGDSRAIARNAVIMLVVGVLALALVVAVAQVRARTPSEADVAGNEDDEARFEPVVAVLDVFAAFLREQRNLERWNDYLAAYLEAALGAGDERSPGARALASPHRLPEQAGRLIEELRQAVPLCATVGHDELRKAFAAARRADEATARAGTRTLARLVAAMTTVGTTIGLLLARLNRGTGERPSAAELERLLVLAADKVADFRRVLATAQPEPEEPLAPALAIPAHAAA